MIRAAFMLLIYLLAVFLPQVPAMPGTVIGADGCGCSTTIEECCCAAPDTPSNDRPGWKTCPRERDNQATLPTLPNHLAPIAEVAESATPELPRPANLLLPPPPILDPTDAIPRAC